ncbi:phosphoserine phosphatase SerB [Sneathiella sp. HT1-7]|uniref:phosphoserine phosphatase SerB n=1 Tax=Sneathiella sp. HT1-7 TaxID=2887192 RepID=UPI001D1340EA|nr:phosphoserine phosphatase SerB [Sneathiella sp. HT1-7]MCC3305518.1 phosphoserine phosphatase SerB [Sneathiella sp. HT1-7]
MTQKSVLTLVADHTAQSSIRNIADIARKTLIDAGANCAATDWLKEDHAVDIAFDELERNVAEESLKNAGLLETVDFCLQPGEFRRKKLFLADMDSTIITVECIDELADFAGFREEVSEITEQAMNGELDFNEAFRARVAMLKGLREDILQQVFDERVTLTPGTRTLVQTMRSNGTYTALVSGGFTFFTGRVRDLVGFHMDMSNKLLFENGALTGVAVEPILNSAAKLNTLESLRHEYSLRREETAAIGDGANDIPMIEAAGLGVAYHAKAKAAAAADATIRFGDLTTLLYYQGYRQSEFVQA